MRKRWTVAGAILAGAIGLPTAADAGPRQTSYTCVTETEFAVPTVVTGTGRVRIMNGERYKVANQLVTHLYSPTGEYPAGQVQTEIVYQNLKWETDVAEFVTPYCYGTTWEHIATDKSGGVTWAGIVFDLVKMT